MKILLLGSRGWIGSKIQKQRPEWSWTNIHSAICDLENEKMTESLSLEAFLSGHFVRVAPAFGISRHFDYFDSRHLKKNFLECWHLETGKSSQ